MTQVTRVDKVEETTFVDPPGQPLPANPLSYPLCYPRLSFLYGTFLFLVFGQKPLVSNYLSIFKPPRPLGIDNIQAQIMKI